LAGRLRLKFSHHFPGIIWNTTLLPERNLLLLEIRNHQHKIVSFSAFQYLEDSFLWRDFQLEETWWVNLAAATADKVVFTIYLETQNPDKKGILVYHLQPPGLCWWNNDFSLTGVFPTAVKGYSSRYGNRELTLDLQTGTELAPLAGEPIDMKAILRPVQYVEGTSHFDTVRTFLEQKLNLLPVATFEYLEYDSRIFISYYVAETGLANYLLVIGTEGEVLLHEKLDEQLKGIGMDTFFVLPGCLIFVKNREDLVSYFL
jgi:hypothetical protein